jgi:hypothetical protein
MTTARTIAKPPDLRGFDQRPCPTPGRVICSLDVLSVPSFLLPFCYPFTPHSRSTISVDISHSNPHVASLRALRLDLQMRGATVFQPDFWRSHSRLLAQNPLSAPD